MSPTLFEQGIEIMLFGMGTVIAFLTLLVFAMGLMSRLLEYVYPATHEAASSEQTPAPDEGDRDAADLLAVITAAVHRHRQQSSRNQQEDTSHG